MSYHSIVISIDLGLKGAICITLSGNKQILHPMPINGKSLDWDKLKAIIKPYRTPGVFVVFERLGQIYQSSKATAMSMGRQSEGMIVMCKCLGLPYKEIPPKVWQKEMFKGMKRIMKKDGKKLDTKAMALTKIRELYPGMKLTFGTRATKPHDGLVDSVLIGCYAIMEGDKL